MLAINHSRAALLGFVAILSVVLATPPMVDAQDASFAPAPVAVSDEGANGVRWAPEPAEAAAPATIPYDLSVDLATGERGETAHLATVPLSPAMTTGDVRPADSDE